MTNAADDGAADWLKVSQPDHDNAIGLLFKGLYHSLRQTVDEALTASGVGFSFAHFATLFSLLCEPGITGAQLARRAMVSAQTMNAVLRRLERDGHIERRPHPDSRRADSWRVTVAGERQLKRARVVGDAVFSSMLSALNARETAQLQKYLQRCITALEKYPATVPGAAPTARRNRRRSPRNPKTTQSR